MSHDRDDFPELDYEAQADAALALEKADSYDQPKGPRDRPLRGMSPARLKAAAEAQAARELSARGIDGAGRNLFRRKRLFLKNLAMTGILTRSAAAAGWNVSSILAAREADPEFAAAWDQAREYADDSLEAEARRRAMEGTVKPVFQQGKHVGYVREFSDPLLIVLLKAYRPQKFRDNQTVEHKAAGGVLVVPGVSPADAWEKTAAAGQAVYRVNEGEVAALTAPDPLA